LGVGRSMLDHSTLGIRSGTGEGADHAAVLASHDPSPTVGGILDYNVWHLGYSDRHLSQCVHRFTRKGDREVAIWRRFPQIWLNPLQIWGSGGAGRMAGEETMAVGPCVGAKRHLGSPSGDPMSRRGNLCFGVHAVGWWPCLRLIIVPVRLSWRGCRP